MDEAAARLRMAVDSKPEELDELDRRIMQLKIEREALKKETDAASRDRLTKLEAELANLEQQAAEVGRMLPEGLRRAQEHAAVPSPLDRNGRRREIGADRWGSCRHASHLGTCSSSCASATRRPSRR